MLNQDVSYFSEERAVFVILRHDLAVLMTTLSTHQFSALSASGYRQRAHAQLAPVR